MELFSKKIYQVGGVGLMDLVKNKPVQSKKQITSTTLWAESSAQEDLPLFFVMLSKAGLSLFSVTLSQVRLCVLFVNISLS